jgi:Ankyrin repeat
LTAEGYYLDVLENLTQELGKLSIYFRASANISWFIISCVQGRPGEIEVLAEKLDGYINHRLLAFAKKNSIKVMTGSASSESTMTLSTTLSTISMTPSECQLFVEPAIEAHDLEIVFLALRHCEQYASNWRDTQDCYAKSWFLAALKSRDPATFRLLFYFGVNVNQTFDFTPNDGLRKDDIFQAILVNVLFIAIATSAKDTAMESIALMCIDHGAQWELNRSYEVIKNNNRSRLYGEIACIAKMWNKAANFTRTSNITALHLAAYVDSEKIIRRLQDIGANVNAEAWIFDTSGPPRRRAVTHTPGTLLNGNTPRMLFEVLMRVKRRVAKESDQKIPRCFL